LALLHDVGKVEAYEWGAAFRRSDQGRLLDHVYMGTRRVEQAIEELPGFPSELRARVLHAILSHHGKLEAGSPIVPQTLEAIVLNLLDMLDAYIRGFLDHVERHAAPGEVWTEYSRMFNAALYRGSAGAPPPVPPSTPRQQALPWSDEGENEGDLPF
jgi:3'-5' exoribonuclease